MAKTSEVKILTKGQKVKILKKKLYELKDIKLKQALSRYGEAFQDSGASLYENAAWELADEEVSVLRAMIVQVENEIKTLELAIPSRSSAPKVK